MLWTFFSVSLVTTTLLATAQEIDKTKLAMDVSAANEANNIKLKDYIWKRKSDAYVNNELKLTTLAEVKFNAEGKLENKMVDASTTVKAKPGLRGRAQQGQAEESLDYIEKALGLMLQYTYMSKGELVDFFDKATLTTAADGRLQATGTNVLQAGDQLVLLIDPTTNLFVRKTFKAKSGADPIEGTIDYDVFKSSGINHVTKSYLMMPAKAMQVNTENIEYTQRVQ